MTLEPYTLSELVQVHPHQIGSKSLSRKLNIALPLVAYALAAGESISDEQSTLTRLFVVIKGTLAITTAEGVTVVAAGQMVTVPAGVLHALEARSDCQYLQLESKPRT